MLLKLFEIEEWKKEGLSDLEIEKTLQTLKKVYIGQHIRMKITGSTIKCWATTTNIPPIIVTDTSFTYGTFGECGYMGENRKNEHSAKENKDLKSTVRIYVNGKFRDFLLTQSMEKSDS